MEHDKTSVAETKLELGAPTPSPEDEHVEVLDTHDGTLVITDVKGSDDDFKLTWGLLLAMLVSDRSTTTRYIH